MLPALVLGAVSGILWLYISCCQHMHTLDLCASGAESGSAGQDFHHFKGFLGVDSPNCYILTVPWGVGAVDRQPSI
jgi:hypothetical protein